MSEQYTPRVADPRPEARLGAKGMQAIEQEGAADVALRVAVQPGGCAGLRYAMYLDDQLTEKDITEAARALTGWSLDRESQKFIDRPRVHDDGDKTFLGRTGPLDGYDVIEQIVAQPQAGGQFRLHAAGIADAAVPIAECPGHGAPRSI